MRQTRKFDQKLDRELGKTPGVFDTEDLIRLEKISRATNTTVPRHFVRSSVVFLAELIKWNRQINLVSRRDEQRIVKRHLLDSLCLLSVEPHLSGKRLLDVGSGAGFPGIVLAIWEPELQTFLVESRSKRIAFLKAVRRSLCLDNVRVLHSRVERLGDTGEVSRPVDIVVSRGVGKILDLVTVLSDMLATDGMFVCYKGPGIADELKTTKEDSRLEKLGFDLKIAKPAWQDTTVLVVLRKSPPG